MKGEEDQMRGQRKVKVPKLAYLGQLRKGVKIIRIKKAGIYKRWKKGF
jgi:hypothetical protein